MSDVQAKTSTTGRTPTFQDEAHAPRRKTLDLNLRSFCLGDLTFVDIKEYLKHSDTILIPKASLEQHGPHLPLYCDTITSTEVARRAGEQAGIMYTPTLWLGYSPQHMRGPGEGTGTITLRVETYLNLIYDLGRSLIHHGFNRLIFVNGHGSNIKVIDPVLRTLRSETGALISYYKPYAERYIGMLKDVLEGPADGDAGLARGRTGDVAVPGAQPEPRAAGACGGRQGAGAEVAGRGVGQEGRHARRRVPGLSVLQLPVRARGVHFVGRDGQPAPRHGGEGRDRVQPLRQSPDRRGPRARKGRRQGHES